MIKYKYIKRGVKMKENEVLEYIELLKPVLIEYAKQRNMTLEDLMLTTITLEDTKLFNYKGRQSTVYNRLKDNNIHTLKDLFEKHNNNSINYGKNEFRHNHNFYIHNEIDGIIALLKFKYLGIIPENLNELLNYQINMNFTTHISPYSSFGYPGDLLKSLSSINNDTIINNIYSFYKTLKSCGFDQSATKALIDIAYEEKLDNLTLGEFLSNLSLEKINKKFEKVERELKPFLNILNIILDYYKNYYQKQSVSNSK